MLHGDGALSVNLRAMNWFYWSRSVWRAMSSGCGVAGSVIPAADGASSMLTDDDWLDVAGFGLPIAPAGGGWQPEPPAASQRAAAWRFAPVCNAVMKRRFAPGCVCPTQSARWPLREERDWRC